MSYHWAYACAYAALQFSCGVWTVCVQQFEFGLCMYVCGVGLFLIYSKLTHGLRKRFPYKKLTQPYARAGFAYALLQYDNTLIKHEHGGLSNGSLDSTGSRKIQDPG